MYIQKRELKASVFNDQSFNRTKKANIQRFINLLDRTFKTIKPGWQNQVMR